MARVWTISPDRKGIGGKKKPRSGYVRKVFLFAIVLTLVIVALTAVFSVSGAGEGAIVLMGLLAPLGAIIACLIFVRSNMSWFIAFFQAEGRMFRVMACNTDIPTNKYIKGAVDKADIKAKAQYIAELSEFIGKMQCQVMQIIGVESISEKPIAFIARCRILYRGKIRSKRLRIIKNYVDSDDLIREFELLKSCTLPGANHPAFNGSRSEGV